MGCPYYHCFICEEIFDEHEISYGCFNCRNIENYCESCSEKQLAKYGYSDEYIESVDSECGVLKKCDVCSSNLMRKELKD